GGVDAPSRNIPVPLKGADGVVGSKLLNNFFEPTTPSAPDSVASQHLFDGAATPPLPRSIQSCPAGQLHNRKEVGGTKTKNLSAYFLERGIYPHQIIANWTLNSKVVHYRFLYLFVPVPFGASIDNKKFRSAEGKLRPLLAAGGLVCRFLDRSRLSSFFSGCVSHSPHNGCTILHRGFRGLRTANQTSRRRPRRLRMASRTCRASGW